MGRSVVKTTVAAMAAITIGLASLPGATASTITSAGPIAALEISPDLQCSLRTTVGDQFFGAPGPSACGTFLAHGGTLYGPASCPACTLTKTNFVQVSQTPVTGLGVVGAPYQIVTAVATGAGFSLSQEDQYITGNPYYSTNVTVTNTGGGAASFLLYHAADCMLNGNDNSYGAVGGLPGTISCTQVANNSPNRAYVGFDAVTAGATYEQGFYSTVWTSLSGQTSLPNTCTCGSYMDDGMAIEWAGTLSSGASATYWFYTRVTPDPPVVKFTAVPNPVCEQQLVNFIDASFANPPATITFWEWDFGDGTPHPTGTTPPAHVQHAYATAGTYTATLEVTDSFSQVSQASLKIVVQVCFNSCPSTPGWTAVFQDTFATDPNLPGSPWDIYRLAREPTEEAAWSFGQVDLTTNTQLRGSAMFANAPLPSNQPWQVRFKYNVGGGTSSLGGGGDGLVFHFTRDVRGYQHLPVGPEILGARGLGFNPAVTALGVPPLALSGYGLEFLGNGLPVLDAFPAGQISLVDGTNLLPTGHLQQISSTLVEDNAWHQVKVEYDPGWPSQLKVSIAPVPGAYVTVMTYSGLLPAGGNFIGFSASTTVAQNRHSIGDVLACVKSTGATSPTTPPTPTGDPCVPTGPFSNFEDFVTDPFDPAVTRWSYDVVSGDPTPATGNVDQWLSVGTLQGTAGYVRLTRAQPGLFAGIQGMENPPAAGNFGGITRGFVWTEFDYNIRQPGGAELRWYIGNLSSPLVWVSFNDDPPSPGGVPWPATGSVTVNGDPLTSRPRSPVPTPVGGTHHAIIILTADSNPGQTFAVGGDVYVYIDASPWISAPVAVGRHNLPNTFGYECASTNWPIHQMVRVNPMTQSLEPVVYNWGFGGRTDILTNLHQIDDVYVYQT